MLGITFSPQNYHHHQQFLSKLREINENVMTSAVWAVIVFGPRVWQLSARCHYVLRGFTHPSLENTFETAPTTQGFGRQVCLNQYIILKHI
jgi:hypothetical protein